MILASAPFVNLIVSVLAAVAYAGPALPVLKLGEHTARRLVILAWLLHGIALSLGLWGETARFGFAPALSVTAWLIAAVYAVESQFIPQLPTRWTLAGLGAGAVLLALAFPGSPMHASASAWLPLHLAFGVACYGLFGTAVVHAWFMIRAEKRIRHAKEPHSGVPLLTLERLTYRFVAAGFVLLSATLLAGFFFSEYLYGPGRIWRWEHKTVFSLLSWITFAWLLIGRQVFGWRGKRAVNMLYAGSVLLLLAYVGSRFVLEIILGRAP